MSRRLLPDGLAGRFALLLAAALLAANVVALALLSVERLRLDRAALAAREVERVVSLVPAIEAVNSERRRRIARDASTRFSRVFVAPEPIVRQSPRAPASRALTDALTAALPDREVRGAVMLRRFGERGSETQAGATIAISIRLDATERAQWLNLVSRDIAARGPGIEDEVFFLLLGCSLVFVLGVGWVFVRRLTRPLSLLAGAARAAGQGDRTLRVPETGAREVREAAAAFNDMQARIARFDAERLRTLAALGHDLRTPITSLRIRAEMLDAEDAAPMIRTLDEMTVMADGLVAYARGAGQPEETRPVDLNALLKRICDERGAHFAPAATVVVDGRPVALGRAFGNLVDNALRYAGTARVNLARERDEALVTVEDDGPGIPQDRLEQVFEPFVRGEDSRSVETGGAGLGLSIARNVLAAHGGSIDLRNRSEGGLQARVRLPARTRR